MVTLIYGCEPYAYNIYYTTSLTIKKASDRERYLLFYLLSGILSQQGIQFKKEELKKIEFQPYRARRILNEHKHPDCFYARRQRGGSEVIIGIDLGGVKGRERTAWALLTTSGGEWPLLETVEYIPPEGDEHLIELLMEREGKIRVLAIDAPLTYPVCVRCRLERCPGLEACEEPAVQQTLALGGVPYNQRLTDLYVQHRTNKRPIPTMHLGMVTARAVYLLGRLRAEGFPMERVIEVYPGGALHTMREELGLSRDDIKGYKRSALKRLRLIEVLEPHLNFGGHGAACVERDDFLDAVLAAYIGYLYPDRVEGPPEGFPVEDGWIYLPSVPVWT